MKKVLLFLNAMSGHAQGKNSLFDIVYNLGKYGYEVTPYIINHDYIVDTNNILKSEASNFDMIACYGGDGTLNRIINSVISLNIDLPIGYIPGGTTNDFASNIWQKNDIDYICECISHEHIINLDIGKMNDTTFNYVAAFGAFTQSSYDTNQELKNKLGYGAYKLSAIANLGESLNYKKHLKFIHDGVVEEGDYMYGSISNARSVGGMKLPFLQLSELDDGKFEVLLVKAPNKPMDIVELINGVASDNYNNDIITTFMTNEMQIISDENIDWTYDGEYGGSYKELSFRVLNNRVKLFVE